MTIHPRQGACPRAPRGLLDAPDAWKHLLARAERTGNDTLGLDLGRQDPGAYPPWREAPSLRQALVCLARKRSRPWEQLELRREDDLWCLRRRFLDGRALQRRQEAEMALAALVTRLREVLGANWQPAEVHFQHPRPADCRPHRSVFGPTVLFGQEQDAIYLDDGALRLPVPAGSAPAPSVAGPSVAGPSVPGPSAPGPSAETVARPLPPLAAQVRAEIRSQLSRGEPRLDRVAEAVGLSPWTLQRRLARQGEVFSEMVDEMRRALSLLLLNEPHLPVTEIAAMLGYSELSAFSRVCRRWFGLSPTHLRARGPLATRLAEALPPSGHGAPARPLAKVPGGAGGFGETIPGLPNPA